MHLTKKIEFSYTMELDVALLLLLLSLLLCTNTLLNNRQRQFLRSRDHIVFQLYFLILYNIVTRIQKELIHTIKLSGEMETREKLYFGGRKTGVMLESCPRAIIINHTINQNNLKNLILYWTISQWSCLLFFFPH